MTLKEELSLDRRNAIADQQQQESLADKEMRKIIEDYINPIIKQMHNKYRTAQTLTVITKNYGGIYFYPLLDIEEYNRPQVYTGNLSWNNFAAAAIRVASEFGFKLPKLEEENPTKIEFTMVLDD